MPDQQAFLGKLVQLQNVIDSASVGIKAQLLAAQTSISQISGQRIAQNIKADDEISKDLLKISAQLVVAAIKPDEADLKGIISDGLKVTTSLSLQLGNNAAFGQLLSEANKQLNAANSNAAALEKLRDDKARIVVEGQKLGLLPNITYNAQAGTFTTASPSRGYCRYRYRGPGNFSTCDARHRDNWRDANNAGSAGAGNSLRGDVALCL